MAIETIEIEPTLWSGLNFNLDDVALRSAAGEDDWDLQNLNEFWDCFESDLNNDPPQAVMCNKVTDQTVLPNDDYHVDAEEYLHASAFLSPVSMAPSSPPQLTDDSFEQQLNLNEFTVNDYDNVTALDLLNKILCTPTNNEKYNTEVITTTLNVNDYFSVDIKEESNDSLESEANGTNKRKAQPKRKARDSDSDYAPSKRCKKPVVAQDIKKERKKNQNKSAANRYRMKKRVEQEVVEQQSKGEEKRNEELKHALEKLQMEYKVVHPLAEAAFATDSKRKLLLQMLHIRVLKDNLLD